MQAAQHAAQAVGVILPAHVRVVLARHAHLDEAR